MLNYVSNRPLSGLWTISTKMGLHWLKNDFKLALVFAVAGGVLVGVIRLFHPEQTFEDITVVAFVCLALLYILFRLMDAALPATSKEESARFQQELKNGPMHRIVVLLIAVIVMGYVAVDTLSAAPILWSLGLDWAARWALKVGVFSLAGAVMCLILGAVALAFLPSPRSKKPKLLVVYTRFLRTESERLRWHLDGGMHRA